MVRKFILGVLIIFVLAIAITALVQSGMNRPAAIISRLSLHNQPPLDYKRLIFRVNFYGFLPLGYAEIRDLGEENFKGRKVHHLSAEASLIELISRFFEVKAKADSYVDLDRMHSLKFSESLIIPDKAKDEKEISYDQERNVMTIEGIERYILPDTQDPLSAMLYIRRSPLEVGKDFDININTNQKNYRLYVKVIGKQIHNLDGKATGVWVMRCDIRRRDESPYHSSEMMLWLMDEASRTPILLKVMASGVYITARLIEVQ